MKSIRIKAFLFFKLHDYFVYGGNVVLVMNGKLKLNQDMLVEGVHTVRDENF